MTSKLNALAQTVAEETAEHRPGRTRSGPMVSRDISTSVRARSSNRVATPTGRTASSGSEGAVENISPPVLSGQGAESGRSRQRWWVGLLAVALAVAAIVYFWGPGPVGIALEGIVKAGDESAWRFPERHSTIRERFVSYPPDQPAIGVLGSFRTGSEVKQDLGVDPQVLADLLGGMTHYAERAVWVPKTRMDAAVSAIGDKSQWTLRDLPVDLQEQVIRDDELPDRLRALGINAAFSDLLLKLLVDEKLLTARGRRLREAFINGTGPVAISTITVNGSAGAILVPTASSTYSLRDCSWRAVLARIDWGGQTDPEGHDSGSWTPWSIEIMPPR
jgi:hypothetical protein